MPIYEYVCQSCQHRFEVKQSFSDPPVSSCAQCGQPVTKVISAPAIMFKGTGWYITDYSEKLKPGSEPQTEDKRAPAQKKDDEPSTVAANTGTTAPTSSNTPSAPASPPAAAGSSPTPATPSSSSTK